MDESSPRKVQEKMSAKSGGTKSDSKGVGMVESLHTKSQKKMPIKSGGTNSVSKAADMVESSQAKPHLFLDELEVDFTGTIVVMIGRVWDGNVVTGRYLSTDFVVSDSRLIDFDHIKPANNKYLIDVTGYVTYVGRTNYTKTGSKNLDFYLANQRVTLWGGLDDALIERKTKHVGVYAIVLTSVSLKIYNSNES
nr:hypothetical protein [Tanacetum cinerariifolium]